MRKACAAGPLATQLRTFASCNISDHLRLEASKIVAIGAAMKFSIRNSAAKPSFIFGICEQNELIHGNYLDRSLTEQSRNLSDIKFFRICRWLYSLKNCGFGLNAVIEHFADCVILETGYDGEVASFLSKGQHTFYCRATTNFLIEDYP